MAYFGKHTASDMQIGYTTAKITADPFNYRLTEKVKIISYDSLDPSYCYYNRSMNSEEELLGISKLKYTDEYFKLNPIIKSRANLTADTTSAHTELQYCLLYRDKHINFGFFTKHNDLIVNQNYLISSFVTSKLNGAFAAEDVLVNDKYLESLECLFVKMTSNLSINNELLYVLTTLGNDSLKDLIELNTAKDFIKNGKFQIIGPACRNHVNPNEYLEEAWFSHIVSNVISTEPIKWDLFHITMDDMVEDPNYLVARYMLSLYITYIFGMEVLYQYSVITNNEYKCQLAKLFNIGLEYSPFVKDNLYTYDSVNQTLVINPEIEDLFSKHNDIRFENFKTYFYSKINIIDLSNTKLPEVFTTFVNSCYHNAYQQMRIKHVVLLYKYCKDSKLINKDTFKTGIDIDDLGGPEDGMLNFADDESMEAMSDLLNLHDIVPTDNAESANSADEIGKNESENHTKFLDVADAVKKDLSDSSYDFVVHEIESTDEHKDTYNLLASNVKMITHRLSKQIKEIKTYNEGGKNGGQSKGKIDTSHLYKYQYDPKIFYNNKYKLKEMDLAFGIILDQSGSMSGTGIKDGRITMILLHEVLMSLGINHSVIGHTSSGMYNCIINKYFNFKEDPKYTLHKPYELCAISAHSGNCDSGSLYYMESMIKQVHNKDKIVIIFSDGQPTECTESDLKEQVRKMEKEGIHVIGIGIDFPEIEDFYSDSANGKNLSEMLDIVCSILKRYVLEKKE